jgi:Thymidylate synthase complementing protein
MSKITAKVLADSINSAGIRLTTFEIEYPRFILAELNTHRILSKNSASSRAIPIHVMHKQLNDAGAEPVYWGKNQAGMQAKESLVGEALAQAKYWWDGAKDSAIRFAQRLAEAGAHKQITNRVTEPWMMMKTVITGTEWTNFYYLRNHPDAQPEIQELARVMYNAHVASKPKTLEPGEWHLPYVWAGRDSMGNVFYRDTYGTEISLKDAKIISASCCAQVSYRKNDDSLEKARRIFDQLINSKPAHASPVEHQATPMPLRYQYCEPTTIRCWAPGITHTDRKGEYWSGNFKGWVQHRKLIPDEAQWGVIRTEPDEQESI